MPYPAADRMSAVDLGPGTGAANAKASRRANQDSRPRGLAHQQWLAVGAREGLGGKLLGTGQQIGGLVHLGLIRGQIPCH